MATSSRRASRLSAGEHAITLLATDRDGQQATAQIQVFVQ